MLNKSTIISLVALVLLGVSVSRIKYEVVLLVKKLSSLEAELEKANDDLRVYSAEWSYLNSPKRLKKLCEKYLKGMRPTENSQIVSFDSLKNNEVVFEQDKTDNEAQTDAKSGAKQGLEASQYGLNGGANKERSASKKALDAFIDARLAKSNEEEQA